MTTIFRTAASFAVAALMTIPLTAQEPKLGPGTEKEGPAVTLQGTLVDAGCRNRTALNLGMAAEQYSAVKPAETPAAQQAGAQMRSQQGGYANPAGNQTNPQVSASGITVDPKTIALERPDVLEHQVSDLRSRQLDPTCAVTGATHNYSIYLPSGRFLNLDEGGNTFANEAVLGNAQGREMLAGNGGGFKPQVVVKGNLKADKVVVQSIKLK